MGHGPQFERHQWLSQKRPQAGDLEEIVHELQGGHTVRAWHGAHLTSLLSFVHLNRVSQEECARLRESVPYVKVYRYNPKHLCPKLNGYGDNGQRSLKL